MVFFGKNGKRARPKISVGKPKLRCVVLKQKGKIGKAKIVNGQTKFKMQLGRAECHQCYSEISGCHCIFQG